MNGERFNQCKFLLLNVSVDNISSFDEIMSIDEAAEEIRNRLSKKNNKNNEFLENDETYDPPEEIPPEVEFWGHCSNMQVWVESNYDTRLLHKGLALM